MTDCFRDERYSFAVLSYNQGEFLNAALDSLLSQGDLVSEITIVDPGSTDSSRHIATAYSVEDNRVSLILEPDDGPADGLNKALKLSKSEFFGYLNANDLLVAKT